MQASIKFVSDDLSIEKIIEKIGDRKIEIIIAGPPCQGFSLIKMKMTKK